MTYMLIEEPKMSEEEEVVVVGSESYEVTTSSNNKGVTLVVKSVDLTTQSAWGDIVSQLRAKLGPGKAMISRVDRLSSSTVTAALL